MTRKKRTAEELRIAILEKIKELEEDGVEDINKTAIANAVGINNTLVTSLLNELIKDELIQRKSKNFRTTDAGKGWLMITKLGKKAAGLYYMHTIERPKTSKKEMPRMVF